VSVVRCKSVRSFIRKRQVEGSGNTLPRGHSPGKVIFKVDCVLIIKKTGGSPAAARKIREFQEIRMQ
jgi:hypothetical protein